MASALSAGAGSLLAGAAAATANASGTRSRKKATRSKSDAVAVDNGPAPRQSRRQGDEPSPSASIEVSKNDAREATAAPQTTANIAGLHETQSRQSLQRYGWASALLDAAQGRTRRQGPVQGTASAATVSDILRHPLFSALVMMALAGVLTSFLVHWTTWPRSGSVMGPADLIGKLKGLENSMSSTSKVARALQVQVDLQNQKIDELGQRHKSLSSLVSSQALTVKDDFAILESRVSKLDSSLQKVMADSGPMIKKEILALAKSADLRRMEGSVDSISTRLSLEEVRDAARKVVEEELARHSADAIGRADYALSSGGAKVLAHSEAVPVPGELPFLGIGAAGLRLMMPGGQKLHPWAANLLQPGNGVPGGCLPLKGTNGTVDIALRTSILPSAITLEHVAKSVAYEIESAPQHFQIFGWLHAATKSRAPASKPHGGTWEPQLLGEFRYSVDKLPIQTFELSSEASSGVIDCVRLHVLSNHGNPKHTCVYRLRVHGAPSLAQLQSQ
eukprot:jgi/Mesen1/1539/ME000133S00547